MSTRLLDSAAIQTQWPQTLSTVTSADTNVVITNAGTPVAALVSYQDFRIFQQALEKIQSLRSHVRQIEVESKHSLPMTYHEESEHTANKIHFETGQQEIEAIRQLAKRFSGGWTNPKKSLEVLEEMREESSCR